MDLLNQKLFGGAVLELLFCCLENVLQVEKMELGVFVVSKRRELCSEVIPPPALGGANQPLEGSLSLQTPQGKCKERSPDLSLTFSLREAAESHPE